MSGTLPGSLTHPAKFSSWAWEVEDYMRAKELKKEVDELEEEMCLHLFMHTCL